MGKFEIKKRRNGEYQFDLKASNGQIILTSEGYLSKESCKNGIESVKKNSQIKDRFDSLTSKNGKYYFNLKAANGQIIGTSQLYESETIRDIGIISVEKNAFDADVFDYTIEKQ